MKEVFMDERIRQEYHRIYSELYLIILCVSCVALVVKIMFLQKSLMDCWLEYMILVGSPLYRFVRCRMLRVAAPAKAWEKQWKVRMAGCLVMVTVLYCLAAYIRTGEIAAAKLLIFLVPFVLTFLLVGFGAAYLQKRWQKKMEDKYSE